MRPGTCVRIRRCANPPQGINQSSSSNKHSLLGHPQSSTGKEICRCALPIPEVRRPWIKLWVSCQFTRTSLYISLTFCISASLSLVRVTSPALLELVQVQKTGIAHKQVCKWDWGMAQMVKCLPWKHKDLSSIPRTYIKMLGMGHRLESQC